MKKVSVYRIFYNLNLTIITFVLVLISCQKTDTPQGNTASQIDSIVTGNLSLHYIYDGQQRVIEERLSRLDTPLLTLRRYEFNGNNALPFKRNYFRMPASSPEFSSVFSYNNSGQKIYDSSYCTPGSGFTDYSVTRFDYSVSNKIGVTKKVRNWMIWEQIDTIFVNNNSNIDSIRTYWGANNSSWTTIKFQQYDPRSSFLRSLSISQCNFYMSLPNNFAEIFSGQFYNGLGDISLDYFNLKYFINYSIYDISNNVVGSLQNQYQFNNDDLPVLRTTTSSYSSSSTITRFVYR